MNQLRPFTALIQTSITVTLIVLFSTRVLYAFSDMNDSTAQANAAKALQKRIDSLELRFEKMIIEQNDAKRTVFDWDRGLYASMSVSINNFDFPGIISIGYMFNKTKDNNKKYSLRPLIRFGSIDIVPVDIDDRPGLKTEHFLTSIGYERLRQTAERVSFLNGIYLNVSPDFKKHQLFGVGMEYGNSLDFWFSESSSLGIGIWGRFTSILGEHKLWHRSSGVFLQGGARITYTQGFLMPNSGKK